jgi:hypothetical protein
MYRGVDYAPTWPGWSPGAGAQFGDSDFYTDAFAALWGNRYYPATQPSGSVPVNNNTITYRDDLGTIHNAGFNLVRLYDWGMARGTTAGSPNAGADHANFLQYAKDLGITVVVPVSDYFLSNDPFAWQPVTLNPPNPPVIQNPVTPTKAFDSATDAIKQDFKQFIASITDPSTGKIFSNVMISVGNEPDYGTGPIAGGHNSVTNTNFGGTTAAQDLARTNWWIYNLHQQINGSGTGPDGLPVVNGANGEVIPISATFANGDQGGTNGSWFQKLIMGATSGSPVPSTWLGATTFDAAVTGLKDIDPSFANYYFNSFNIGQSNTTPPYDPGIARTLGLYDGSATPWPGTNIGNVPLMLMEVFTPNRQDYTPNTDQTKAAIQEVTQMEAYILSKQGGTAGSTTNLIGYNYFAFNDEPELNKFTGLFLQSGQAADQPQAQTGTTSTFYGGFGNATFPVFPLTETMGNTPLESLVKAWTSHFPHVSIKPLLSARPEDDGGLTPFTFTVSRTGDILAPATVDYAVTGSGTNPADAADFLGAIFPSGLIEFAAGEIIKTLTIFVKGDATVEPDNGFTVALSNPTGALAVVDGSAGGTILSGDSVTAHGDAYVILQGHSLTAAATLGVLANDEITQPASAATLSGVSHGQLQVGSDGGVSYTPSAGFTGIDNFIYYAFGATGSDIGYASVYVVPVIVGATTTLNLLGLNAQEQIASTYAAFFGRAGDATGVEFWVNQFNTNLPTLGAKAVFTNIANSFAASAEAKALYPLLNNPVGASDAQINGFVDSVYNNLFNRSADAAGSAYWNGQVKQAGAAVGSVLINIISGAQDTAVGKDITTLMSKVATSLAYVEQQELHGTVWAGASDVAAATTLLHAVTSDPASLLVGIRTAEELIANHP